MTFAMMELSSVFAIDEATRNTLWLLTRILRVIIK